MSIKSVAVLRGGPSSEYEISLETGSSVINALRENGYRVKDIVITKKAEWLSEGFVKAPQTALEAIDVVFVALHGQYGEDGRVQRVLEQLQIPFTGSRSLTSAIAFNKELTKQTLLRHGIKTPRYQKINKNNLPDLDEEVDRLLREVGRELVIKPVAGGSSIGVEYVNDAETLRKELKKILTDDKNIIVEEFVRGKEATVGIIENFRGNRFYPLPVVEIVSRGDSQIFTYEDKYINDTDELVPGRFSYPEKSTLTEFAEKVHSVLGCRSYSRSDFIVREGEVYFLEINTLPGLTPKSLFPKAALAVGLEFNQLVDHLVKTATV